MTGFLRRRCRGGKPRRAAMSEDVTRRVRRASLRLMETPPPTPEAKPPLGRTFYLWLFAPVISMAVATAATAAGEHNGLLAGFGNLLGLPSLLAMIACSVACSMMVGKRQGGWIGLLTFLGIQVVYVAVAVAGCSVMIGKTDFR